MGFPVPLTEWLAGPAREFAVDMLPEPRGTRAGTVRQCKVLDVLSTTSHGSAGGSGGSSAWSCGSGHSTTREHAIQGVADIGKDGKRDEGLDHRRRRLHRLASGRPACWRTATRRWSSTTSKRGGGTTSGRGTGSSSSRGRLPTLSWSTQLFIRFRAEPRGPRCRVVQGSDRRGRADVMTNAVGTANVVDSTLAAGLDRLIYFQTALCYGTNPRRAARSRCRTRAEPDSSYAISKTAGEQYIQLSDPALCLVPSRECVRATQHFGTAADVLPPTDRRASPVS